MVLPEQAYFVAYSENVVPHRVDIIDPSVDVKHLREAFGVPGIRGSAFEVRFGDKSHRNSLETVFRFDEIFRVLREIQRDMKEMKMRLRLRPGDEVQVPESREGDFSLKKLHNARLDYEIKNNEKA
jgi:hypothetical protein